MPRDPLPYVADDVSALAKSLRRQLGDHLETHRSLPSHVQLLQMLARAGGHRNHQSLRAAARRPGADAAPSPAVSDPPRCASSTRPAG
ncbi:hypothetical protein ABXN37_01470 [Piscinibacter sakaiensis]|uniref:hypothetical protein n=1 Tax=Piscinibacter sakaiensis TaxID=1547922 RepID=UPI00372BC46D